MNNLLSETQGKLLPKIARNSIMKELHMSSSIDFTEAERQIMQAPVFHEKLGVFVTLHLNGQLRGCIGNLIGVHYLLEGVEHNAVNAAFYDTRFRQVTSEELERIDIEVSVLSEPKSLDYRDVDDLVGRLRPGIDGVIISKGQASATFLPQVWEQLPDAGGFLSHLCIKAGLPADEWRWGGLSVMTYQVQCFSE
jgi:AmmeMemoRadiSam system protein A